jgi:hypothetical protein
MTSNLLKVNKHSLIKVLDSAASLNKYCVCDVDTEKGILSVLAFTPDNTLIFYGEVTGVECSKNTKLNLPDVKKLARVIEHCDQDVISLKIEHNNLQYSGNSTKFKYHLYDDGFLSSPPLNTNKIKQLPYDVNFTWSKSLFDRVLKGSSFSVDSNKIYIFTEDNKLKCEFTDRARHNVDALAMTICDSVDFELKPFPFNLTNFKIINIVHPVLDFYVNTSVETFIIDNNSEDTKLKYIISPLIQ